MIKEMLKEKFMDMAKEQKFLIGAPLKGDLVEDTKYFEMVSEDGTDYLQGVIAVSIGVSKKAPKDVNMKVLYVYIDDKCRRIGFGSALVDNAVNMMLEKLKEGMQDDGLVLKDLQVKFGAKNESAVKFFESIGFSGNSVRGAMLMKMQEV